MMHETTDVDFSDIEEGIRVTNIRERINSGESEGDTFYEAEWRSARLSSSDETTSNGANDVLRLAQLEEEQERLNNSLFSLSSQFAQVQFRLKQIAEASGEDKERLLKDLQNFAFKGCADVSELKRLRSTSIDDAEVMAKQKERQNELLHQLKEQLEDLEKIAYESGEGDMPSTLIIQKQKSVLEKLQQKIQLNLEMEKMSDEDLQKQVDEAIKELVNPFKEKEQLMEQLQTQIIDLERFVNFLQKENAEDTGNSVKAISSSQFSSFKPRKQGNIIAGLIGCSSNRFQRNQLKTTSKGNHYGDERARLQLAVDATVDVLKKYTLLCVDQESPKISLEYNELNDDVFERSEEEVVTTIRKRLCPSLRSLLEHGMMDTAGGQQNYPGLGCFSARPQKQNGKQVKRLNHIWDVIVYFYESRHGRDINDAPVRLLSQSFKLDNVNGRSITSKQVLLTTIENILSSHARLQRSCDAQWKAFVSAALNEKKLPAWLRIIFRTRQVVEQCYNPWSYVARTGCEELYQLLESLHEYNVELPVDLALRPFQQMKEAF